MPSSKGTGAPATRASIRVSRSTGRARSCAWPWSTACARAGAGEWESWFQGPAKLLTISLPPAESSAALHPPRMLAAILASFSFALVQEPQHAKPDVLRQGHYAELRGTLDQGRFVAEKAELQAASSEDVLIGTVPADQKDPEGFELLGQWVLTDVATKWQGLERGNLAGQRI